MKTYMKISREMGLGRDKGRWNIFSEFAETFVVFTVMSVLLVGKAMIHTEEGRNG